MTRKISGSTPDSVGTPSPAPRRADARRTHERIVGTASTMVLEGRPLSMSSLAREAGVSRPTLYQHFPSTEDVLEAAVRRAVDLGQDAVEGVGEATVSPTGALARLLEYRWSSLAAYDELYRVAAEVLPPARMLRLHHRAQESLGTLIDEGRAVGEFRADLPTSWWVTVVYGLLHQAAHEVLAGRLTKEDAGSFLSATILSTLAVRS
ncbi:TetR/AcrR family transcriptional regulator [Nocardioides sp. zg-DK7169]|uniref:TetR/AcrR family transcriptional regulator n=1 Tax=Nocardioides sp. zg-DK7169 TaxID=2736600 RepID=UPI001557C1F6|nr:TetR/AcrR family transcriptional regulator [Nocardioides sp. zg-DK7169]NPC96846.1 TetR/AcrR family transcriptional regulator [Nocardioides sp. zg-DK7169]